VRPTLRPNDTINSVTIKFDVENLGPGGRYAVERVAEITGANPKHRVLELGAGHGIAAIHLAETRQCRVVATDINTEKLERLQKRVLSLRLESLIHTSVLNCTKKFRHSTASFDLVLAGSVLDRTKAMHIPVQESYRVLRYGGHLAIYGAVWKRDTPEPTVSRVLGNEVCSMADYELLLTQSGFRIAISRLLPDYLWADYYRQFIDALEAGTEKTPDLPQPWGWYEEAAIVLCHLNSIGVGLVIGRKDMPGEESSPPLTTSTAIDFLEASR